MKKNADFLIQTGITTDGKMVLDGIWYAFETYGLPLDIIISICKERDAIPDWILLYQQMKKSGMKHDRIISKLEESISDSFFGKEFCNVVVSRLDEIFGQPKPTETDSLQSKIKNIPQTYVANVNWTEDDVEVVASSLEEAREKFRAINPNWKFIHIVDVFDVILGDEKPNTRTCND